MTFHTFRGHLAGTLTCPWVLGLPARPAQPLSCGRLCNPMGRTCQAFLAITNPGVYPNPRPSSWWCHPAIPSSVVPFSCPQSFPASRSFQMSQLSTSGDQSIGVSASVPPNEYWGLISFRMDWLDHLAVQRTLKSLPTPQFKNINSGAQLSLLSNSHIHTWLLEKP